MTTSTTMYTTSSLHSLLSDSTTFVCSFACTLEPLDNSFDSIGRHTEKGILKKHGYGLVHGEQLKDKWCDDSQSDNLELITQDGTQTSTIGGAAASEVERTLKSLNGYHEDILEALRNAASHRGTGTGNTPVGSGSLSEEMLRKTLQDCNNAQLGYAAEPYKRASGSKSSSRENICDSAAAHAILLDGSGSALGGLTLGADMSGGRGVGSGIGVGGASGLANAIGHGGAMMHHHRSQHQLHQPPGLALQQQPTDEDDAPSTGPLRIRNLEDLIRQLEHHSSRHMSPSGSEDIRMSETEADRHYRLDSSAACSESSQGLVSNSYSISILFRCQSQEPEIPNPRKIYPKYINAESDKPDKRLSCIGFTFILHCTQNTQIHTRTQIYIHTHTHTRTLFDLA